VGNVVRAKTLKQVLDLLQVEVNEMPEYSCAGRLNPAWKSSSADSRTSDVLSRSC
jgi:hypothetical protein